MVRVATSLALACLVGACSSPSGGGGGGKTVEPPKPPDDRSLRIQIAKLEGAREVSEELVKLLDKGDRHAKLLALRALGRIGGGATSTISLDVGSSDPEIAATAMGALGLARELDDTPVDQLGNATELMNMAFDRITGVHRLVAIEALGRAGNVESQALLVRELSADADRALTAGVALARMGRRKIPLAAEHVPKVIAAMTATDPRARYGAVYAIARASGPIADPGLPAALALRVADPDPAVRAQAIVALGKHGLIAAPIENALLDQDWKVVVEAVRVLTSDKAKPESADAVAVAMVRRLASYQDTDAHILLEGLRGVAKHGKRQAVGDATNAIIKWAGQRSDLVGAWALCLSASVLARKANALSFAVECKALPDHLRLPLVADLVADGVDTLAVRSSAVNTLLNHTDPRVRAGGLSALSSLWKESTPAARDGYLALAVGALAAKNPIVAGAAVENAEKFYEAIAGGDHLRLDTALVARAATETDPELSGALLELIGKQKVVAGLDACRAGLAGSPVRAKAARGCLAALGETPATIPAATPSPPPPVDVATVIGAQLDWHVVTTRGEIVIELRPDVAPWAVASIVALTTAKKYDGLEFHRVVPDFVVQGGDPTESGWGGPGYVLPSEPSTSADGSGYVAGGVGMADSGRDSAGSQWFVMHSRAAHLDGRYTWIGNVRSGQKSADALLIGDRVLTATIAVRN